jgi:hypothetical protein
MSRMNWGRIHQRRIMRTHGCESVDGDTPGSLLRLMGPPKLHRKQRPHPRPTKEELRAQAAQAFLAWRERQ